MFSGGDKHSMHPYLLGGGNIVFEIVADHESFTRRHMDADKCLFKEGTIGLAQDSCLFSGCQLQRIHIGATIEHETSTGAPVEICMHGEQHSSIHKHTKCLIH